MSIFRHSMTNMEGLRSFSNEKPDFWANRDKIKIPTDACVVNAWKHDSNIALTCL